MWADLDLSLTDSASLRYAPKKVTLFMRHRRLSLTQNARNLMSEKNKLLKTLNMFRPRIHFCDILLVGIVTFRFVIIGDREVKPSSRTLVVLSVVQFSISFLAVIGCRDNKNRHEKSVNSTKMPQCVPEIVQKR